jgi:hypothetical protein
MLILTLVEAGIDTPYRWQAEAGLSLGATLPSVRRLLDRRLVSEAPTGPRRRREFTITRAGRTELRNLDRYLERALAEPVGDLESVLRLFSIAKHLGREDLAVSFLEQTAVEYDRRVGRAQKRASDTSDEDGVAALYLSTTSRCEASRLQAHADTLRALLSQLRGTPAGKRSVRRKPSRPDR